MLTINYSRRTSSSTSHLHPAQLTTTRYIERWQKQHGKRLDHDERVRKRQARESHKQSQDAQNLRGFRAKMYQQKRHAEKIQMKKRIKAQEEKNVKSSAPDEPSKTPLPNYLLDRSQATNAKALSSAIKDKRNEKAAKFSVPLPKVKGVSEEEMFKVVNTGKKTHKKAWKRMITQPTFVGNDFTRRAPKYERFIRPMGLRYKKANVTQYVPVVPDKSGVNCPVPSSGSRYNSPFSPSRRTPATRCTPNSACCPREPSSKSTSPNSVSSPPAARSPGENTPKSLIMPRMTAV